MTYTRKEFEGLKGTSGFSDKALDLHLALYDGYLNNINKLADALSGLEKEDKSGTPEYAELKRRFGWEWDGMRLHEYYFENFGREATEIRKDGNLYKKITENFGSFEKWEKNFRSVGAMRGIGWVVLYYDSAKDLLFNVWINEHDVGHLCGTGPLLVMDVFEHAYFPDWGKDRAGYIEAFMAAVRWDEVEKRLLF